MVYADEKKLWFHDRATGKTEEEGRHGNLMGLKYSPDGRFLIGINAKELMILDAKTRDVVAKKAIGPGFGGGVEISQDSKRFVTTGVSGGKFAFYVFSLPDHELQYTETNVAKAAFSLALSPDGNYLALGLMGGATSGTVQIWDLTQKKAVASWTVAKVLPLALAFSPDGKTLVTGSGNFIEVWDLAPEDPGWVQLFNGKDLTGWVPKLVKEENPFSVAEGALVVQGSPDAYLRTDKTYENFVLELECKSHRTFDVAKNQYGGAILLQMPLPDKMTVGLRAMIFPSGQANLGDSKGQFPPDLIDWRNFKVDWNQLKIESQRGKLAITLNGARVFERSNHEPVKGYLGIWSTGSGMRYRNIRIKELPVSKPAAEYALQFDGKTSHVAIPSLKRDDPNSPLTLEAWVRPEEIKDRSAAVVVLGGKGRVQLVQKPGDWSVVDYHSAKDFDHDPVKAGTAVHLAYVLDGKEARFYVGGVEVGRQPFVPSARDLEGVLHGWLGAHNDSSDDNAPGYFFAGIIGEVRISSVARYAKNFQPAQRFEPDPDTIALFHCDENSGDKLIDASGNKHHGNIVGAKWVIRPP